MLDIPGSLPVLGRAGREALFPSSLSERRSLAPCGRLVSGKIAQKQTKNGHEALYYRVLRQAARGLDSSGCSMELVVPPRIDGYHHIVLNQGEIWFSDTVFPAKSNHAWYA